MRGYIPKCESGDTFDSITSSYDIIVLARYVFYNRRDGYVHSRETTRELLHDATRNACVACYRASGASEEEGLRLLLLYFEVGREDT